MIETKINIELSENTMKKLKKDPVAYEAYKRIVKNERLYEKQKNNTKNSYKK